MADQVLILGGNGRIGRCVAADLLTHTTTEITVTGRKTVAASATAKFGPRVQFLALDLADQAALRGAIARSNLVIHCAGPFHYRDASVLKVCIEERVNYLDVSDNRAFTLRALAYNGAAQRAGVTAIINSGIFPGISNSIVRQGVEQLDEPEQIHLSYVVAGSGGAGITVMRTTFLGLQSPFDAWIDGQWQQIQPYSDREAVEFPGPYRQAHVYWFDMPEAFTLPMAFPVKTVITKFGSVPDFYNHLTWIAAHWFPASWMRNPGAIEFLARVSHRMTAATNPFSGIGVAIRSEVSGRKAGKAGRYCSTLVHENTAIASGYGTGSLAELLLTGQIYQPGVYPVEQVLPTPLFEQTMQSRGLTIYQEWLPEVSG